MGVKLKSTENRFGTMARFLHWTSALLFLVLLGSGFRAAFVTDVEAKATIMMVHLPTAIAVLLLTIGRLIWWWRFDHKPDPVSGTSAWQNRIARWTHRGLYAGILLMLASGIAMSAMSGLPGAVFGDAPYPELADLPPRSGHWFGARFLTTLILLHAGAALFHHFILKDRTLKRMLSREA
jgi:cytochrome b561